MHFFYLLVLILVLAEPSFSITSIYNLDPIQNAIHSKEKILLIIDNEIAENKAINSAINRYADDLNKSFGMAIDVYSFPNIKKGGTAQTLRSFLQSAKDSLIGAIFIGDLPRAQFEFIQNPNTSSIRYQRWISDFYFMDLDGIWLDTASGNSESQGGLLLEKNVSTPIFLSDTELPSILPLDSFSIRYRGLLKAPETGICSLSIISDNQRRLWMNDTLIIDAWIRDWDHEYFGAIPIKKNESIPIQIDYAEEWGGSNFKIYWKLPNSSSWVPIPDSVWYTNEHTPGLTATYFGNVWLHTKEENPTVGTPTNWKSNSSNGIFDGHYSQNGAVSDSMEIWISRIDPYTAGVLGNPTTLLLDFFDKLHSWYNSKKPPQSHGAYFITTDADTSAESDRKFILGLSSIYGREKVDVILADGKSYLENIANPIYGWSTYVGHGDPISLANGFKAKDLKNYSVGPRIFHFASCSPLENYDFWGNPWSISVGSAHLFGTKNGGFVAIGASKTSGDNQLDDLMYYDAENTFIGAAYLSWINQRLKRNNYKPLEDIYDWFYVETLIGDPLQFAILTPEYPIKIERKKPFSLPKVDSKKWDAAGRLKSLFTKEKKAWFY